MLFACLYLSSAAQADSIPIPQVEQAAEPVEFRVPDKTKIEEFQKDSRFNYERVEKQASWWDRLLGKIIYFFARLFGETIGSGIPSMVVILVIILALSLITLKLLGVDYKSILSKKKVDTSEIDIYSENVHDMDFDTLIANALKNRDYRLVIRFLYLKSLKSLSDKEIIEWKANKTNYSYQYEIENSALRSKFLEATLIFDYVWYGEFSLDEQQFSDVYSRMDSFNKTIANER
ncbi:hypothetical protein LJC28_03195 [Dysgonomonas sp. OttesenSCG-928-D17]|nr:hypothetical protein [Dysgonomonas sp. OttesenSCG-928-D17]